MRVSQKSCCLRRLPMRLRTRRIFIVEIGALSDQTRPPPAVSRLATILMSRCVTLRRCASPVGRYGDRQIGPPQRAQHIVIGLLPALFDRRARRFRIDGRQSSDGAPLRCLAHRLRVPRITSNPIKKSHHALPSFAPPAPSASSRRAVRHGCVHVNHGDTRCC